MSDEIDFVEQLKRQFAVMAPVATGIGDDGAVLTNSDDSQTVAVTDMLLDGVHFDLSHTPADSIGRKAVAVNLSDLAAMGCRPTAAFVSIAVPKIAKTDLFLRELYQGIQGISEQFEFTVAGGDTNSWEGPFAINVCMTGEPFAGRAILRSGARPGDSLLVTGALGGSLASGRHLSFEPRLGVSERLVNTGNVNAMMDISDGLAIDLHRMMRASDTGAVLTAQNVPIHQDVDTVLSFEQRLQAALSDGEDFELLLAMPKDSVAAAQQLVLYECGLALTVIGKVTHEPACRIADAAGVVQDLPVTGWQHG